MQLAARAAEVLRLAGCLLCMVATPLGCDRAEPPDKSPSPEPSSAPSPASGGDSTQARPVTPIETVRHVHRLRTEGRTAELEAFLPDEQREHVIDLIQSMDHLLSANGVLQEAIKESLGSASTAAFDRSLAANAIGVFSRDVRAISERIDGDKATVVIQVSDRVPLSEVRLVRQKGTWCIRTDEPNPQAAAALRELGEVMTRAARRLSRTPMTAVQLKRELASAEAAVGRRLDRAQKTTP